MADGEDARRRDALPRHAAYPYRAASGFTSLFTLFAPTPNAPQARAGEEDGREAERAALHKLVLGLTLVFMVFALAAASALVVYTAWTHDLGNGVFALAAAVATARIAMNWLVWKDEEE